MLYGRDEHVAQVRGALRRARGGSGSALLVEGEPGIGKSALVAAVRDEAEGDGFRVLAARGIRGGADTGFAALHELLLPVLDRLPGLPSRQRAAVETVFGLADGAPPEPLVLHVAVLALLEEVATSAPLLVVTDDLHWFDRSSAEVIGFLATRLAAVPVVLVATSRIGEAVTGAAFGARISLSGLGPQDADRVVADRLPGASSADRRRIVRASVGNPLALVEFSADGSPRLAGRHATRLPMTQRLEQTFLADAANLPEATRRALLVSAAGERASVGEITAALALLGLSPSDLALAERAGLVRVRGGGVQFRHPLIASAVYDAADADARAGAHRALAEVVHERGRAAQHLAAATVGWDESVALRLDDVARTAEAQGARAEATTAWLSAADLSADVDARAARLANAAESARRQGDVALAGEIALPLRGLAREPETVRRLVTTEWMLSQTTPYPHGRSAEELVDVALTMPSVAARTELLVFAAVRCYILQDTVEVARRIADELGRLADEGDDALLEIGLGLVDPGRGLALDRALEAFRGPLRQVDAVLFNCLAFAAEEARDLAGAERVWTAARDAFHAAGRTGDEATALCGRSSVRLRRGRIGEGMADASHALRLSDELDLGVVGAMAAAVLARARALRGELDLERAATADARERAGAEPFARVAASLAWAAATTAAAEGRHGDAAAELERTRLNAPIALWALAELAEPALRIGAPHALDDWFATAGAEAVRAGSAHLSMLVLRARAVLVGGPEAGELFARAVDAGTAADAPVDLARTRMHYGEWLRRERRIKEAREQFREALPALELEGLTPFVTRVVGELRAAGESVAGAADGVDAAGVLTAQELQVARLAAQGLTNKAIADQIYLSHRTVGAHLHRAFGKLGISRRAQLAAVLGER